MNTRRALIIIGWATLIAGGLDFLLPSVTTFLSGGSVARTWQFVARGLFGQAAYSMGAIGVLSGIFFHFMIMAIFSAFMFFVYTKLSVVDEKWALCIGVLYGMGMWFVMNVLVVPLSRLGKSPPPFKLETIMNLGFLVHVMLGVIIVFVIRRGLLSAYAAHPGTA